MKILFTPYCGGSIAHVTRSLAVADELNNRGHQIFFTASKSKKKFIENAGYPVFGCGHSEVNFNDESAQDISYFDSNYNKFVDWFSDEIKAAECVKPDIVVNSPSFPGALLWHKLKIPYVTVINANWIDEYKGLLGFGKCEDSLQHKALRLMGKPIFRRGFEKVYVPKMASFYREFGLEFMPSRRADLHKDVPLIIPSVPEFEPVESRGREDITYVGPLFWKGFENTPFEEAKHMTGKPLIYVSLGGSIHRIESYNSLIQALMKRKNWNIVLSIGPNFSRSEFPDDLPNFKIRSYVPGLEICKHADVVINTASHGTVMQALYHGKPLVVVPYNIDQVTFAERLVELGLGINLNRPSMRDFTDRESLFQRAVNVDWRNVFHAVEEVLSSKSMYRNALDISEKIRRIGDASFNAANNIEEYAKK